MKESIQKQADRLYYYSQTLNVVSVIFRHIFSTLPWFLPETAMLQIEKLEAMLQDTKTLYEKLHSPQQDAVQNTTLNSLLTQLKQQKKAMADLLKATLQSMEDSLQEKHQLIFKKINHWKVLLKAAEGRFTDIGQRIDRGDRIPVSYRNAYNLLLSNLTEQAESVWSLFHDRLKTAIKDQDTNPLLQETLAPDIIHKSKESLRRLQINRSIVGGGKWLFYEGHQESSLLLAGNLLKENRIVPILEQTSKLFERYSDFLLEKQTTRLKKYFGSEYQEALVQQEDHLFLQKWLHILEERRKPILALRHRGLTFALAAKGLLYTIKNQYYFQFYQATKQHKADIIIALATAYNKKDIPDNPYFFIQMQKHQQKTTSKRIRDIACGMKNYSYPIGMLSAGVRLWAESFYFQWANRFFMLSNAHTARPNTNASFLRTRLSKAYITFFSTLLSAALFTVDFYVSKRSGGSYILLMTLPRLLLSDIETMVGITDRAQISRTILIQNIMPSLEWMLGLLVMVGFHVFTGGLLLEIVAYSAAIYILATACRRLAGTLLDKAASQHPSMDPVPSAGYSFLKNIAQQGGYWVGAYLWKRAYPQIRPFFTTPPDKTTLLNNKRLCALYPKPCKEAALEVLELPLNATKSEIKKRWGTLIKETHPDRTGCDTAAEAAEVNNAKRVLLKN